MSTASPARFWTKVNKDGELPVHRPELGPCWNWVGAKNPRGRGHVKVAGRYIDAHKWAWEQEYGSVPDGLQLDHLCQNVSCVRPSHLEAVTAQVNAARWAATVTHCPQGHMYDEANTYYRQRRNERHCRACNRERMRRARAS